MASKLLIFRKTIVNNRNSLITRIVSSSYNTFPFQEINKLSLFDPNKYWYEKSKAIPWFKSPSLENGILDTSDKPFFRWFPNTGKISNPIYCKLFVIAYLYVYFIFF